MRIVSLLSMWVRLIVDNFRVYDEMNNSASRPRATSQQPDRMTRGRPSEAIAPSKEAKVL